MSLKELNDNWEKQFLGYTFSKRLEQRMLREHTERMLKEVDHKIFECAIVSVLDKRRRIKGIGLNVPNDLILDNFGTWLAGLIRAPADSTGPAVSLKDAAGTSRTLNIYGRGAASVQIFNHSDTTTPSLGTQLQVGSGTTPAARTDYAITTPFTVVPESDRFATGPGSYAAGAISLSGAITAGGSGTANETGFFAVWNDTTPAARTIMLFHDILAAGVAFTAGKIINVSYSISL